MKKRYLMALPLALAWGCTHDEGPTFQPTFTPTAQSTPYPEYKPDPISRLSCIDQANLAKAVALLKENGMDEGYMLGMVRPGVASQMVAGVYDCPMSADAIWARAVHLCEDGGPEGQAISFNGITIMGAARDGIDITSSAPGQCTW